MQTITTKQLREDMPAVMRRLRAGEPVTLTYRKKIIATLQPTSKPAIPERGSPEAVLRGLAELEKMHVPESVRNDPRSMKEMLAEYRDQDYQ